jgi:hypothetical protein
MPLQQEIDGAFGVGDLRCGEIALAILARKAAGFQERIAVAQGQAECCGQLQQDVAAADGLAGLDIAQMLDRNAGLKRQIGLAHGAAVAPAAQEIADGIDPQPSMFRGTRIHAPIMRRPRAQVNAAEREPMPISVLPRPDINGMLRT